MRLRDVLKTKDDWCKFAPALDGNGKPCKVFSPCIARRCLETAVQEQDALPVGQLRFKITNAVTYQNWLAGNVGREFAPGRELTDFNDDNCWDVVDQLIREVAP